MAGKGPVPAANRRRANQPGRGDWAATPGIGWQHGKIPAPPPGLMPASQIAWRTWFRSWFASHWLPDNLPDLRTAIRLLDQVERGEFQRSTELRLWEDNLGITLKGQQDRRWTPPLREAPAPDGPTTPKEPSRYKGLRVVNE